MRGRVIGPVALNTLGSMTRMPPLPTYGRDLLDEGKELSHIVAIGPCQDDGKWNAIGVCQHMMFTTQFPPIRGVWACPEGH